MNSFNTEWYRSIAHHKYQKPYLFDQLKGSELPRSGELCEEEWVIHQLKSKKVNYSASQNPGFPGEAIWATRVSGGGR
jgi:hypothetical protein